MLGHHNSNFNPTSPEWAVLGPCQQTPLICCIETCEARKRGLIHRKHPTICVSTVEHFSVILGLRDGRQRAKENQLGKKRILPVRSQIQSQVTRSTRTHVDASNEYARRDAGKVAGNSPTLMWRSIINIRYITGGRPVVLERSVESRHTPALKNVHCGQTGSTFTMIQPFATWLQQQKANPKNEIWCFDATDVSVADFPSPIRGGHNPSSALPFGVETATVRASPRSNLTPAFPHHK